MLIQEIVEAYKKDDVKTVLYLTVLKLDEDYPHLINISTFDTLFDILWGGYDEMKEDFSKEMLYKIYFTSLRESDPKGFEKYASQKIKDLSYKSLIDLYKHSSTKNKRNMKKYNLDEYELDIP